MNAVMNLWVSFSGITPLYEVTWLVFYLCRKYCCGQCVSAVGSCVCASQSGLDTFFFYVPESFKNADTNVMCNNSGVQENLINSKLVNSEYHIIRSMTFLSITHSNLAYFMYVLFIFHY